MPPSPNGSKIKYNLHMEDLTMQMSDVIADMLTRIRNASNAKHATVDIPASNMKKSIADILAAEGYISGYEIIEDNKQGTIRVALKYTGKKQPVIRGIRRVSKPGLRIYAGCEDMPRVMNGLGIAIVSTSKGIITDKLARKEKVGGEVIAFVW
jgi:small subunit ribosomal protein S8